MKKQLAVVLMASLVGGAQAADNIWAGDVAGAFGSPSFDSVSWEDGGNWYDGLGGWIVPGAGDDAHVTSQWATTQPTVSTTGNTVGGLYIGHSTYSLANSTAQLTLVDGGGLTVLNEGRWGTTLGATALVNLSGNASLSTDVTYLGFNWDDGSAATEGGSAIVTLLDDAVLEMSWVGWGQDMTSFGAFAGNDGTGTVNMTGNSKFIVNQWADGSWANERIAATGAGESIEFTLTDLGGGLFKSEYTVIPEPATFGLFAMLGGGMLWIRRKFMI